MPAGVTRPTFTCRAHPLDGADTSSSGRAGMINSRDRPNQGGLVVRRATQWGRFKELLAIFSVPGGVGLDVFLQWL